MHVLVTGAHGFLGSELCRTLLRDGLPGDEAGAPARPLTRLTRLLRPDGGASAALQADPRVRSVAGDAADGALLDTLVADGVDVVFALGGTLSSEAEADFARGLEVNLHGLLRLLEACRLRAHQPRLVYAGSIAAYGGPLPDTVDDLCRHTPQSSYGTQKAIAELLISDYSRRGHVDGRVLRLPVVIARPWPQPRPSVSDRVGALVREPLAGRDVVCPLEPDSWLPIVSMQSAVEALRALAGVPASAFEATRAMNLPSLSVQVRELVRTVQTLPAWRGWRRPLGQVSWEPDAALQAVVGGWPQRFDSELARRLGLVVDRSLPHLINRYINAHVESAAA